MTIHSQISYLETHVEIYPQNYLSSHCYRPVNTGSSACVFKARMKAGGPLWKDLFTCPLGLQFQEDKGGGWGAPQQARCVLLKSKLGATPRPHPREPRLALGTAGWAPFPRGRPGGQTAAPPAGEQTGHSAAARGCQGASPGEIRRGVGRERLQKRPSRRPRRTWYLAAGAERDAAVSCRPWGARAPASRSACCWLPRSWSGRRPQRGNARPALPASLTPHLATGSGHASPKCWSCAPRPPPPATTWRGSLSLALPPRCLCAGAGRTRARMCSLLFPALFFPARPI